MAELTPHSTPGRGQPFLRALAWYGAAVLGTLVVVALNGGALFYFDTGYYIIQGLQFFDQLGLGAAAPEVAGAGGDGDGGGEAEADISVSGSRSAVYSILIGTFARLGALPAVTLVNVAVVLAAVWLPMRIAKRIYRPAVEVPVLVALPLLVASLGALPFYVAYLMPDIFAPVLILTISTLTVFARHMRLWEILAALALAGLSVATHLSHLGIAAGMVPLAALAALILHRRRWWLPALLAVLVAGFGVAERTAFSVAAEAVTKKEVVYNPFITARLIVDGPGLRYLEEYCPDDTIATCPMKEALSWSDDPKRITPTNILFAKDERLGTFRRLPAEAQKRIATDQFGFFLDVLRAYPFRTALAFLENTLIQANMYSVEMTVPSQGSISVIDSLPRVGLAMLPPGTLTPDPGWLHPLTSAQGVLYLASLIVIAALVLRPGHVPAELKMLAVLLILGVLVNAFVCGGVSQPATRYGARVIWLLPLAATMLVMFTIWPARPRQADGGR